MYTKEKITNMILGNNTCAVVKMFQGICPDIKGEFYDENIPSYSIYRGDIDKVRLALKAAAIKACQSVRRGNEMAETLIACTAGAVCLPPFAEDILTAHFIDIEKLDDKSLSAIRKKVQKKKEFNADTWNRIAGMDDDVFQDLLGAIASKKIIIRNTAIKAIVIRRCLKWINPRAVSESTFWSLVYMNLDLRYCDEPHEVEYVDSIDDY